MTAIVGVEDGDHVFIGADSACTSRDHSFVQLTSEKVWVEGEWIFGSCGSLRLLQILRHMLVIPQAPERDVEKFLVTDFIDAVRACVLDAGVTVQKDGVEYLDGDSDFLVGLRGCLYLVQNDFSITRSATGYYATGCGIDLALGALHATRQPRVAPKLRVRKALEAAATHNSAVAPPFVILST